MTLKLLDWSGQQAIVDIGELKDIKRIIMTVISGDEKLLVQYKDDREDLEADAGEYKKFVNYFDGRYKVYDEEEEHINLLENERFLNRKTTYWFED